VVQRNEYLSRLAKWREKKPVKTVSGVRGCGKKTLLAQYIDWLKRTGVQDAQIIYISLDDPENESLFNYQGLYGFIKKRLARTGENGDKFTYIFIDEIQKCTNYEKAVEGLLLKKQVDLYVTASNSRIFAGVPHVEIKMLPLSFAEYLVFTKARTRNPDVSSGTDKKPNLIKAYPEKVERRLPRQKAQMEKFLMREAFNGYLSFGGFPFTAALDSSLTGFCVDGIYNTVLVKNVARQMGINDIPLLELIAQMMGRSTGRPLSSKKISTAINAKGRKISANTVETYMQALTSAFIFYHAERFDIKTGRHLKTLGKYYIADTGIENLLLKQELPELEDRLENIVYTELLRRGCEVYIGKYGGDEVNFVVFGRPPVQNAGRNEIYSDFAFPDTEKTGYYQITVSVQDKAVFTRKLSVLERIRDNHPKYILSLDETPFYSNYNGIIRKNLIDWLLEKRK